MAVGGRCRSGGGGGLAGAVWPWTSSRTGILVRIAGVAQWSDRLPADRKRAAASVDRLAVRERNGKPDVAGVVDAAGWPCLPRIRNPLTRPAARYAGTSARRRLADSRSTLPAVEKSGSKAGNNASHPQAERCSGLGPDFSIRASAPVSGAGRTDTGAIPRRDRSINGVAFVPQGRATIRRPGVVDSIRPSAFGL